MLRHSRTKLVAPKTNPEDQNLETLEESNPSEQKIEFVVTELDTEVEYPRYNETMEH